MKNLHGKNAAYIALSIMGVVIILFAIYWAPTVFRAALQQAAAATSTTFFNLLGN
ncbi:hypothetical protein HY970_04230 [Candidatus Kaiserbacteria bacterium]|nr:hypothetical protein [Candidatus Kaiserbacteria bacterium]